jgi:hypothetical protein
MRYKINATFAALKIEIDETRKQLKGFDDVILGFVIYG